MYSDATAKKWPIAVIILLLAALVVGGIFLFDKQSDAEAREEGAIAVKQAVEQSALQCYVVEGAYPESVEYLQDHYGLVINHEDYYVTYQAFSTNLPPTVKVTERRHDGH